MSVKISSYLCPRVEPFETLTRTPEELEQLIEHWLADPYWPIEDTRGFEAHRLVLHVFRLEHELADARLEVAGLRLGIQLLLECSQAPQSGSASAAGAIAGVQAVTVRQSPSTARGPKRPAP